MRGRLLAASVCAALALVPTGCATGDRARPVAVPTPTPAAGVCVGVPRCDVVARTDVDGDEVADQVGFVVESAREVVVLVKTSAGQTARHPLHTVWFPRGEFYGAAPIDGRPGAELVVGTNMGAHTLWFTTLSLRDGRIVRLDAPGGEDEWMVDAAFSFHAGVMRRTENGRVVVVVRDAARDGVRPTFTGRDRTYAWTDGGWQHVSTSRRHYRGEESVADVGGWHVDGLPRFPRM